MAENLDPLNPRRPPDWRFQRAFELVETRRAGVAINDAMTLKLVRFLRRRREATSLQERIRLARQMPDLASAFGVREDGQGLTRFVLEAFTLADEPIKAIARALALPPGAVAVYESMFFDVRDRLSQTDFILRTVIGFPPLSRSRRPFPDFGWKLIAYRCGPAALEQLTLGFTRKFAKEWRSPRAFFGDLLEANRMEAFLNSLSCSADSADRFSGAKRLELLEEIMKSLPDGLAEYGVFHRQTQQLKDNPLVNWPTGGKIAEEDEEDDDDDDDDDDNEDQRRTPPPNPPRAAMPERRPS